MKKNLGRKSKIQIRPTQGIQLSTCKDRMVSQGRIPQETVNRT